MLQEAMEKSAGNNLFRLSETAGSAYVVAGYQSQIPQHPYLGYMGGYREDPRPKYGKTWGGFTGAKRPHRAEARMVSI